jgi:hypothetical protein
MKPYLASRFLVVNDGEDIRRTRGLPRDKEFLVNMEPYVRNYVARVSAIQPWARRSP